MSASNHTAEVPRRSLFGDELQRLMYFLLALTLFLAGLVSTVVSWRVARLDTTPKLFTFTFLLVAFGSQTIVGARTSPHPFRGFRCYKPLTRPLTRAFSTCPSQFDVRLRG